MSLRLIGRRPVQYALEGYAKPGDSYITFPDAVKINPAPNRFQVRPGVGMWLVTLTADNPDQRMRLSIQHGGSTTGAGSVTICGRLTSPELWVLASPQGALEGEVRYVLTITKTSPPPLRKCVLARLAGWWSRWR